MGLKKPDKISILYSSSKELSDIIQSNLIKISKYLNAKNLIFENEVNTNGEFQEFEIEEEKMLIKVKKL